MAKKKGPKKRGRAKKKGPTDGAGPDEERATGGRQLRFWPDVRIELPGSGAKKRPKRPKRPPEAAPAPPVADPEYERRRARELYRMLSEVATSLWYLKTKHFRQPWDAPAEDVEDPRERRALGRLAKGVQALADNGIEVHDPTDERYPPGAEAMMKPIQLSPTPGISAARVSETVRPIVYAAGHVIQRGEVFLDVPIEDEEEPVEAVAEEEDTSSNEGDES